MQHVGLAVCKKTGLLFPEEHFDEKRAIKENIKKTVDDIINKNQNKVDNYFIVFHSRFDPLRLGVLKQKSKVMDYLPSFVTNQIVFWVSNKRGIVEWLWSVRPDKKIEFNKSGVAYLQAKGAMSTKRD
jgi:hypothetical protein